MTIQTEISIRASNLGKRYKIGAARDKQDSLRDTLSQSITSFRRRLRTGASKGQSDNIIWALRDVSFEMRQGEVKGIIGRNGAGKSTLLKILSRITEPTIGRAEIKGRVGSLLEVGTGFHPELTGRENIYMNGAILGMRRSEISQKFDEIVAFAEIEKFLDTPVKRYSSGMYVRLAFAVAAHMEPEILLVDEVLAVGDAAFQQKCLGKMEDVSHEGRTILFVSHNMAAIQALCDSAILLHDGKLDFDGPTDQAITKYQDIGSELVQSIALADRTDRYGDGSVTITGITIENADGGQHISPLNKLRIVITYQAAADLVNPAFLVGIYDRNNIGLLFLDSDAAGTLPYMLPAAGSVTCITGPVYLAPRHCKVNVAVFRGGTSGIQADYVQEAIHLEISPSDLYGTGKMPPQHFVTLADQIWRA